jgi:VanZ family protein
MPTEVLVISKSVWMKGIDKIIHLFIFALFYMIWLKAAREAKRDCVYLRALYVGLIFAITTECLQALTVYRSFELLDILADLIGLGIGAFMMRWLEKKWLFAN